MEASHNVAASVVLQLGSGELFVIAAVILVLLLLRLVQLYRWCRRAGAFLRGLFTRKRA